MKKILYILVIFVISCKTMGQTFLPPRSSASTTVQDSRWRALLTAYAPHTHGLTLNGGLDTLAAFFYEDSSGHFWFRDTVPSGGHRYSMFLKNGDAGNGTVTQVNTGLWILPTTITTTGTIASDSAAMAAYFVRRKDSTLSFVTPTQMNAQGFLKTIAGITAGGDLTGTYPNPTIVANAVTFSKFQQLPGQTFLANPTGSPGNTQASYFGYGLRWNNDSVKVDTTLLKSVFGSSGLFGINQLNGDGTAGPGNGLQTFTLNTVNGNIFVSNTFLKFSVNGKGLITAASAVGSSDITGALGFTPISLTSLSATSPIVYNSFTGGFSMANSGVTAGPYTNANITVDAFGRVTAAANGSGGTGGTNSNAGAGFRWAIPNTNNIKTFFVVGGTLDSTTNANAITLTISGGGGAVSSVSNIDGTLTISPTTGAVVASLALGHANTWITNPQTFNGGVVLGNNVTFSANNTYQIGSGSAAASHVWSRIFNSDAGVVLSSASGNPASMAIGASSGITLLSTGQAQFNNYTTSSSFTGTPLAFLQTDASGNIIQIPIGSVQGALTLTTTGSSGPSTLIGNTLNIPQYTGGGGSGTVTSVSSGSFSPLFNVSVATATTTPALSFVALNAAPNTAFGNFTGSSAAGAYGKLNLASMATNATNTLLGYDGSGNPADVTLTTTGTGAATLSGGVLNIPLAGSGAVYTAGNGLTTYPTATTFAVDSVWKNRKVVVTSTFQNNVQEPSVIRDSNMQLYSVPSSFVGLKMLADEGFGIVNVVYYESIDGGNTWTRFGSVISNYDRVSFQRRGDSLIIYAVPTAGNTHVDRFALFAKAAPTTATLTNASVVTDGGVSLDNSWVYFDSDSSAYYMSIDEVTATGYADAFFKSTDNVNWSKFSPGGPGVATTNLTSLWFTKINGVYWAWGHRAPLPNQMKNFLLTPTDIYRQYSPDLIHWYDAPGAPVLARITLDEGRDSVNGQISDPCLVVFGTDSVLMFYDATIDGTHQGPTPPHNYPGLQIKRVVAQTSINNLITGIENAPVFGRLEVSYNTNPLVGTGYGLYWMSNGNVNTPFPNGGFAIGALPDTGSILNIGAGNSTRAGIHFLLENTQQRANLYAGLLQADSHYITYTHYIGSSTINKIADTLIYKSLLELRLDSITFDYVLKTKGGIQGNLMLRTDTIYTNGFPLVVSNNLHTQNLFLDNLGSPGNLQLGTNGFINSPDNAGTYNFKFGSSLYGQSLSVNQGLIGQSYFSTTVGGFVGNGTAGSMWRFVSGELIGQVWSTSTGGALLTPSTAIIIFPNTNAVFNNGTDGGMGQLQSYSTTQAQLVAANTTINYTTFFTDASHNLLISAPSPGAFKMDARFMAPGTPSTSADSVPFGTSSSGVTTYKKVQYTFWGVVGAANTWTPKQTFGAPTASNASINLAPSSAVNPTSPADGDLWYNGTNLDFRHGGTTTDLLAGGGGGITLTTTGTTGAATLVSATLNIPVYQGQLTLTTTGTSGAATLVGNTLNIPQYTGGGGGTPGGANTNVQFNNSGAFGGSANFTWNGNTVGVAAGSTAPSFSVGANAIALESAATANSFITFNAAFNGGFTATSNGFAGVLYFINGNLFYASPSGSQTAGASFSATQLIEIFNSGNMKVGPIDAGTDEGDAALQAAIASTNQFGIYRSSTNKVLFNEDANSFFNIKKTSPAAGGMIWTANLLNVGNTSTDSVLMLRHGTGNLDTVTYVAASSFSGGSQTWQQGLTTGSTLNTTNTVTNTGQIFTWANGGTGTFKFTGLRTDTAGTLGVYVYRADSSIYRITLAQLSAELPPFNLFAANGLTAAGGDSLYFGGTLNQPTTLALGGFTLKFIGLPPAVTATNTTALVRNATDSSLAQMPLTSGTYTTSATAITNCTTTGGTLTGHYIRTGNEVTVDLVAAINVTVIGSAVVFNVGLPISSNLSSVNDAAGLGVLAAIPTLGPFVSADITNHVAQVSFTSTNASSSTNVNIHFIYTVK